MLAIVHEPNHCETCCILLLNERTSSGKGWIVYYCVDVRFVSRAQDLPLHRSNMLTFPANQQISEVEPREFEPLTSAVQRRLDGLLKLSGACEIAAKTRFSPYASFLSFQSIYSGCCTDAKTQSAQGEK